MIARRVRLLASAGIALALAAPSVAAADSIAVLGVEAGDAPASIATALTDGLRKRAGETAGVKLVPSKDFMEMKMLFGCMDPSTLATCLVPAGKSLGADKLVVGTLDQKKKGKKIKVSLKLVDSAAGTVIRQLDEEVSPNDVAGNASRWFSALVPPSAVLPPVTPPPPAVAAKTTIEVTSDPSGAEVSVDGRSVGKTPVTAPVFGPASHTLSIVKDGYEPVTKDVKIKSGEELKFDFQLRAKAAPPVANVEPTPTPTPTPEVPPAAVEHPGRTLKIAAIGVIAGLLAIGIEIYTWQTYLGLQNHAHEKLVDLQNTNGDFADAHKDWFQKPSCAPPDGLPTTSSTYKDYVGSCNDGTTLASVSTALLIGGIVVGVAGIAAFGAGMYQSSATEKASAPKAALVPRLKIVSPVVSTSGGGVTAAFEF